MFCMVLAEDELNLKASCKARFQPAVDAIRRLILEAADSSEDKPVLIAIDGKCGSGKTTLGFYLKKEFEANLFHMDDFFLRDEQRTKERLAEVGGNVDYERFREEVLEPILAGREVVYRPFDCGSRRIVGERRIAPGRINIIEGSYSMHPYFGDTYDLKIFMEISEEAQSENIRKRNGEEKLKVFKELWIPKETAYFEANRTKEQSDCIIWW